MRIVCPQCGYTRDIPAEKIPARSSIATCPKCTFKFRFRGAQQEPQGVDHLSDAVYPPSPSRPVVAEEPLSGPGRFEARTQRIYGHSAVEPEAPAAQYPPRPQARWLPDPEPEQEPVTLPRADWAAPEPALDPFSPRREASPRRSAPLAEESAARGEVPVERGLRPEPASEYAPEYAPESGPESGPDLGPEASHGFGPEHQSWERQPWERLADGGHASPDAPTVQEDPRAEPAFRDAGSPVHADDAQPTTEPQPDPAQPAPGEAVAGQDSVRDIWARLQAMGGGPKPGAQAEPRPDKNGQGQGAPQPDAPPRQGGQHPEGVAPWEQLEHFGVVPAFVLTVKNVLLKPGDFFDQLPQEGGKVRPLLFAVVVCVVMMLFGLVWNFFGLGPNLSELGRTEWFQGLGAGALGKLAWLGLSPIMVVAVVFLDAAVAHLLLGLLRSATRPFDETFRVVCYAGGPWILGALPVPYSYLIPVVLIWNMTLQAIGLKKLHGAGYPQVLASVLVKWSMVFMSTFAVLHLLITRK